jgi:hypothetical protein
MQAATPCSSQNGKPHLRRPRLLASSSRRPQQQRGLHLSILLTALTVWSTFIQSAAGESPNSWVRGSESQLFALLSNADRAHCVEVTCPIPTKPIVLTIRTPISSTIRALITSAELASPQRDPPPSGSPQEYQTLIQPILLRGWIWPNGTSAGPQPMAATITRSTRNPMLSITSPALRRNARGGVEHLSSIKVALQSVNHATKRNARAVRSSRFAFTGTQCGTRNPSPQDSYRAQPVTARASITTQATFPTLYIATDFDPQFASRVRCSSVPKCNDEIIRILHATAVLYETQIGYTLKVARQFGPTPIGDATIATAVLDAAQLRSLQPRATFLHTGSQTSDNQVDLFQFFTGRTMDEKTIGIAYVGTACRNDQAEFSQAVVQYVSDNLNPTIAAHEIGHTLNALHTSTGIMRPNLSSNTPKSFSSSSLLTISNHLSTWYPECRQGLTSGVSTPTPTPQGNGSSSNPYTGRPVTVGLTLKSLLPKTVSISTTVTSISPACSVIIRGGITSMKSLRGEVVVQFTPTENTTTKTGTAAFRIKPGSINNSNIYFVAEHSCTDGTILEVSRVQKINPNRIRGISRSQRSKRTWLKTLRESIQ